MTLSGSAINPADNLRAIEEELKVALAEAARPDDKVTVIGVTKKHGTERILPALEAGYRVFGENRVQEAQQKWPTLRTAYPDIELRLIGPLQTNKVKDAVALFDVIETVDRPKLAKALANEMIKQEKALRLLVQVNIGEEPQKAGIAVSQVNDFISQCRDEFNLTVSGLMCIPPAGEPPASYFALLSKMADLHNLPERSMGMSGDYLIGAQLGATHVRIGEAIFGPRPIS